MLHSVKYLSCTKQFTVEQFQHDVFKLTKTTSCTVMMNVQICIPVCTWCPIKRRGTDKSKSAWAERKPCFVRTRCWLTTESVHQKAHKARRQRSMPSFKLWCIGFIRRTVRQSGTLTFMKHNLSIQQLQRPDAFERVKWGYTSRLKNGIFS